MNVDVEVVIVVRAMVVFDGRVLVVQRTDEESHASTWELPGGQMEAGEKPEKAIKREVLEETGLAVYVKKLLFTSKSKIHRHKTLVFVTYLCVAEDDAVCLSGEHKDCVWADKKQMEDLLSEALVKQLDINHVWGFIDE